MVARVKLRPPMLDILRACVDPNLFGPFLRGHSWDAWFAFLAALFGLPLTPQQLAIYTKHTGRSTPPDRASTEAWLCIGRRGGKHSHWRSLPYSWQRSGIGAPTSDPARSPPS